jgi:hypothetical protein
MGLSTETLKAIQRAQLAEEPVNIAQSFSEGFQKVYQDNIKKLKEEEERLEEIKLNSLDNLDKLEGFGSNLGNFTPAGEKILMDAKQKIYNTYKLDSEFDRQIAQRNILNEVRKQMKPFADVNNYIQNAIKGNSLKNLDKSMGMAEISIGGKNYSKLDVIQAIGQNAEASDDGTFLKFNIKGTDVQLPITDLLNKDEFKISITNEDFLKNHEADIKTFATAARQGNFTEAQVENMVDQYLPELDIEDQNSLLYNFYSSNENDNLKTRMVNRIQSLYTYKKPEAEKPKEPKSGEAYYNATIKAIDELPPMVNTKARGGFYKSSLFTNKLPEGYVSSGEFDEDGDMIIQNSNNNKQILITENEPLSSVKAKLKSIATGRSRFFTQ